MTGASAKVQHELIAAGLENLDRQAWDYLVGGSESETTVLRNRHAIDRLALQPSVLRDVSRIDVSCTSLGRAHALPLFCAPVGALDRFWQNGEDAAARAASAARVPFWFSSLSSSPLPRMVQAAAHGAVYQLYVRGDAAWVDGQLRAAEDAGFSALCLTVDSAAYGRRERDLAAGHVKPYRAEFTAQAMAYQAALTWADIARIKRVTGLPLILKGIATAADAAAAVDMGVEGVYISNHGGRQLDHAMAGFDLLSEIVDAVDGRAEVYVDGGVMRGTDIVKALAIGADMVGIGRLYCLALAAGGHEGVARMFQILQDELSVGLALVGAASAAQLHPGMVRDLGVAVRQDGLFPAFPHLDHQKTRKLTS